MKNFLKLIISIAIALSAGILGSLFTSRSVKTWYNTINKPIFNPPNWLFSPVWTILFILMGISFYIIWKKNFGNKKILLISIFGIQIFLNILWSLFFFGLQSILLGFIEIIILWLFILINTVLFYKVDRIAGIILIPYLLWVSFASILNFTLLLLN